MADESSVPSAGESALVVEFGATADPVFHDRVLALDAVLSAAPIEGIRERVPTYRSMMIHFDPRQLSMRALIEAIDGLATLAPPESEIRKRWRIPACYDPPYAEDLGDLARCLDMAPERIVSLHAQGGYRVVMYGFAPGFVFLAGLPDALAVSRRPIPRPPAPPGALTIANGQALIASVPMPTGWYVLGCTPVRTFDPDRTPPFPIGVGDEVRFERVTVDRFSALQREVEEGRDLLVEAP